VYWRAVGAKILEQNRGSENILTLKLLPEEGKKEVVLFPVATD
jgi:hypothetical protein